MRLKYLAILLLSFSMLIFGVVNANAADFILPIGTDFGYNQVGIELAAIQSGKLLVNLSFSVSTSNLSIDFFHFKNSNFGLHASFNGFAKSMLGPNTEGYGLGLDWLQLYSKKGYIEYALFDVAYCPKYSTGLLGQVIEDPGVLILGKLKYDYPFGKMWNVYGIIRYGSSPKLNYSSTNLSIGLECLLFKNIE